MDSEEAIARLRHLQSFVVPGVGEGDAHTFEVFTRIDEAKYEAADALSKVPESERGATLVLTCGGGSAQRGRASGAGASSVLPTLKWAVARRDDGAVTLSAQ